MRGTNSKKKAGIGRKRDYKLQNLKNTYQLSKINFEMFLQVPPWPLPQIQKDTQKSYEIKKARSQWLLGPKNFLRNSIEVVTHEMLIMQNFSLI